MQNEMSVKFGDCELDDGDCLWAGWWRLFVSWMMETVSWMMVTVSWRMETVCELDDGDCELDDGDCELEDGDCLWAGWWRLFVSWMMETVSWMMVTVSWRMETVSWMMETVCELDDGDCLWAGWWRLFVSWMMETVSWRMETVSWRMVTVGWMMETVSWMMETVSWRMETVSWMMVTVGWMMETVSWIMETVCELDDGDSLWAGWCVSWMSHAWCFSRQLRKQMLVLQPAIHTAGLRLKGVTCGHSTFCLSYNSRQKKFIFSTCPDVTLCSWQNVKIQLLTYRLFLTTSVWFPSAGGPGLPGHGTSECCQLPGRSSGQHPAGWSVPPGHLCLCPVAVTGKVTQRLRSTLVLGPQWL